MAIGINRDRSIDIAEIADIFLRNKQHADEISYRNAVLEQERDIEILRAMQSDYMIGQERLNKLMEMGIDYGISFDENMLKNITADSKKTIEYGANDLKSLVRMEQARLNNTNNLIRETVYKIADRKNLLQQASGVYESIRAAGKGDENIVSEEELGIIPKKKLFGERPLGSEGEYLTQEEWNYIKPVFAGLGLARKEAILKEGLTGAQKEHYEASSELARAQAKVLSGEASGSQLENPRALNDAFNQAVDNWNLKVDTELGGTNWLGNAANKDDFKIPPPAEREDVDITQMSTVVADRVAKYLDYEKSITGRLDKNIKLKLNSYLKDTKTMSLDNKRAAALDLLIAVSNDRNKISNIVSQKGENAQQLSALLDVIDTYIAANGLEVPGSKTTTDIKNPSPYNPFSPLKPDEW